MKLTTFLIVAVFFLAPRLAAASPMEWALAFPKTNFSNSSIDLTEIRSVGAERDSIPAILTPQFIPVGDAKEIGQLEPVLRVAIDDAVRGYPLRILLWHELVNDTINETPILISYCPLCSSGVVFDRRVEGETLVFKNTGLLRHYDTVLYDSATESWWQQYTGDGLVGHHAGKRLKALPSRVQSFAQFKEESPEAQILIPENPDAQDYGKTPYVRMDSRNDAAAQFPYPIPEGLLPLDRVVVVGNEAWPLDRVRSETHIETDRVILMWSPGMNSVHDTRWIPFGRDIGNVRAWIKTETGTEDAVHDTTFAFAFAAFRPDGTWHIK